jgi:hypothetical protein
MKTSLFLSTLLMFSQISNAFASEDQIFTPKERKNILKVIDTICADSWCEGDYDFKFLDLYCAKKTHRCDLTFQFIKTEDENHQVKSPVQTCSISNIKGIESVLSNEDMLNNDFYDELSECILSKEQTIVF